jgi:glycosyltransferase involved in cell wall biosynthesis
VRIVFNAAPAARVRTGIGFYVDQLRAALRRCNDVSLAEFVPWSEAWRRGDPTQISSRPARRMPVPVRNRLRQAKHLFDAAQFRSATRRRRYHLYHEPNYVPFAFDGPIVTTVCDLTALLHPEWHPPERARVFETHFLRRLGRTDRFLVPSDFTRRQMIEHLHVAPERIDMVPLAARSAFRPLPREHCQATLTRLGLPPRYLLFVGTIEPRKNVARLIDAHRNLPAHIRSRLPLVLAGPLGWNCDDVAARIEREAPAVRHLGYVADEDLVQVCNAAEMLVFPSLCEGFGLPPLEMMACGRPVIVSCGGSLPEVAGDAAVSVDPSDVDALTAAIRRLIENPELRERLVLRGPQQAARFTWDATAAGTVAAYRRAIAGRAADTAAA